MTWFKLPTHTLLTAGQAKRQLSKLKLDIDRLPLISMRDAALRDLVQSGKTIVPGDIILIERNSKAAGEGFRYYRKVVV